MARSARITISKYLSSNFTTSFLTIFLPLFFIGTLISIIKISSLTASIEINFVEMMQLFSYNLPNILFYTLPISFLITVMTTLLRLSNDNELMALFALGIKAKSLMYRFLFISVLFSILLFILSLALIPKTEQQFRAFKQQKSTQAQVNINPSKLGQKFGDLFVYVKRKEGDTLQNVVIYNKDKEIGDQLFIAKEANIQNQDSIVTLTLNDGSGYTFSKDRLKEINYEKMQLFQNLNAEAFTYNSIINYWLKLSTHPKKKRNILFFIYISLIPIMALYIVASFAIVNPRYQKNYAYPILGLTIVGLYVVATLLNQQGTFTLLIVAIALTSLFSLWLFRRYVTRYF